MDKKKDLTANDPIAQRLESLRKSNAESAKLLEKLRKIHNA